MRRCGCFASLRALAKQSILAPLRKLDCFVVSLLAMTAWKSAAAFRRHGREARSSLRATHVLPFYQRKDVDARHKAGHDAGGSDIRQRGRRAKLSFLSLLREAWGGWREAPGGVLSAAHHRTTPTRLADRFALREPPKSELRSSRPHASRGRDKKARSWRG